MCRTGVNKCRRRGESAERERGGAQRKVCYVEAAPDRTCREAILMRPNLASGMTRCVRRLSCLLLVVHWTVSELPTSSYAASSDFRTGHHMSTHEMHPSHIWPTSAERQHLLEMMNSVRASSYDVYAHVPSPSRSPASVPAPMPALFPSDPPVTIPYSPAPGTLTVPSGNCSDNFTSIAKVYFQTDADCGAPFFTKYTGVAICCPQFASLLQIIRGQHFSASGALGLDVKRSGYCFSDIAQALGEKGTNISELCAVQAANLTVGSCPTTTVEELEMLVDTSSLLKACKSVDPLKECVTRTCQNEIGNATLSLTSGVSSAMDDCESVVLSWLASHSSSFDQAENDLRLLSSCNINKVCPLQFGEVSLVEMACNSPTPTNNTCCGQLSQYMTSLQTQMLITNQQAYKCAIDFGLKLQDKGVSSDIFALCDIHLSDFSLQADGVQGCLLESQPTDINTTTGNFKCDLNDNIPAPWPSNSSTVSLRSPSPAPEPSLGAPLYIGMTWTLMFCALTSMPLFVWIS